MKKISLHRITGILFLLGIIFISGCDKKNILESGYLEGKISIGPICPVETDPPKPECLPTAETYKAYPVSIWTTNGRIKIAQIFPALDGTYSLELVPGNYLVILEKDTGASNSNLPVNITVRATDITTFDINIDTGIR